MRIKHLLFAVLVAAIGFAGTAEARKLSAKDKAVARKLTAHLAAMGDIMDKHAKNANKALDKLEAYVKTNKPSIKKLVASLDKISKQLDEDEKTKFETYVKDDPDMKKFMTAVMSFGMSLGQDQAAAERFSNIMRSLAPDDEGDKKTEDKKPDKQNKPAKKKKSAK